MADDDALAAGDFSSWLTGMRDAIAGTAESDVPCAGCTACCTSSQFVHIGPDETDALAHIPRALLFPAPLLPHGHMLLGYDERGHCPMLVAGGCSIYEHRPRTCRTYDCRIFPAAGVEADQPLIAARAGRWRFGFPAEDDRVAHGAVQAAAAFLDEHGPDDLPVTRRAVLAVEVHHLFLGPGAPEPRVVLAEVEKRRYGVKRAR